MWMAARYGNRRFKWQRVDLGIQTTLTCLAINWKVWLIGLSTFDQSTGVLHMA